MNANTNSNQQNNHENLYGEPVFVYTSDQAVEDGILIDITAVNPKAKKGLTNYVTVNLLNSGYLKEDKLNIPKSAGSFKSGVTDIIISEIILQLLILSLADPLNYRVAISRIYSLARMKPESLR